MTSSLVLSGDQQDQATRLTFFKEQDMRDVDHPLWLSLLMVNDRLNDAAPRIHQTPAAEWNWLMDEWTAAVETVRQDRDLMALLRERVPTTSGMSDLSLLYRVLDGAVFDHGIDIEGLMSDPRVLSAENISVLAALYLVENSSEADPYEAEGVEDEWRDLTRIGGNPTTTATAWPADQVFLLQVDLRTLWRQAGYDEATAAVLRTHPLPQDGLLQVFHTTIGDSRTDPDLAGGGATVLHISESLVIARERPSGAYQYPVFTAGVVPLPTFRHANGSGGVATDIVDTLQEDAYRAARNGSYPPGYEEEFLHNPFTARVGAVTHLFGLQSPDYDLEPEDRDLLHRVLPLEVSLDSHMLFVEIAGDHTFDSVFGDDGRLEIWIRESDLVRQRYSEIVSFIRSK